MAQHDFNIANATFPAVRSDINSALTAINTSQSGTSRPSSAVAGTIWLDTTSATTPTLKYYDGADDISLATIDHSANTVNWLDSTVSITGLSTTATGTVLTLSDSANTSTVNLIIDNDKEIRFREATANGTNYISLSAPASLSADVTYTLPVAPTANNQALISSTAGAMSFTPYAFPASDGTSGQALVTNGSGALSFGSSVPEQLVKSIPLASGVSVTAGKVVSINTSGEIPAYPTLNTYGTTRANSTTTAYTTLSLDGSRAIRYSATSSGSYVLTFAGVAISNSATPTNGTTNQTASFTFGFSSNSLGGTIYAISNTAFMCNFYATNTGVNECGAYYDMQVQMKTFILTVDSSGNVTKGTENTTGGWGYTASPFTTYNFAKISNDVLILRALRSDASGSKYIITWSGTTITMTSDTDSADFVNANGQNAQITTSNVIGLGSGNSWKTATWTASPVGIGTSSDTTPLTNFLSGGTWYMMKNSANADASYALATFTDTNGVTKYSTFSINQTTGALTSVQNGNLSALVGFSGTVSFKDKDNLVAGGTATSYNFTNGVLNGYNSQSYTPVGTVLYNSGNLFYIFYTSLTNFPNNIGYTVNAYATSLANYLGVVKTTTSSSPASIVTDGVATGFTSLTAGTLYYATAPFDGTVTTSSSSGILVGKAISATEILLQRSNTQ